MKSRLFIGSSRESIDIAHAAHSNLYYAVEVTVWDQEVFQPSITALESLLRVLETSDFGMFVFSPNDLVKIRGVESQAVRDNVIFELGLFAGVLGRERCFILVPEGVHDLRIPTDLIGMTPVTYEINRSDGNLQSATGPACNVIRAAIARSGKRPRRIEILQNSSEPQDASIEEESQPESSAEALKKSTQDEQAKIPEWLDAFVESDYPKAIELLIKKLAATNDEKERIDIESWIGRAKYNVRPEEGIQYLNELIEKHPKSENPYVHLAYAHGARGLFDDALVVAERGIKNVRNKLPLMQAKVRSLAEMGRDEEVETTLRQALTEIPDGADIYLALAEHYSNLGKEDDALSVLEQAEQRLPNDESILARYAKQLEKLPNKKLSLIPYNRLIRLKPEDPTFLTLRGNVFLELDLHDLAMRDYKKANELANGQQGWILGNIGNLLKNRGFYRDGIEYLKQAIEQDPESDYAHERLAVAIKRRDEEEKKLEDILKEARKELALLRSKREADSNPM